MGKKNIKPRIIRPLKWKICTEGVTEANYLRKYVDALGLGVSVDICCARKKHSGCGCKHESLFNQAQTCTQDKPYEKVFLVHDYDEAKEDKKVRLSFNNTFKLAKEESDPDLFTYFGGLKGTEKASDYALKRFGESQPPLSNAASAAKAPCTNMFELLYELKKGI